VVKALREGTAKPEILEFGVVAGSLVINVPSPYLVVPPTANMSFIAAGEKVAGCALPSNRKDVETNVEAC
jgi:hypothetical protein